MTGRPREGIPPLREAIEHLGRIRRTMEATFTTYLCEAHLLARQVRDASRLAERALALSRQRFERNTEARAFYLLGAIAARRKDERPAKRHYHDALALADELDLRPLVAQCHLGLGRLGRNDHVATARTMFREMGMSFWEEKAS